MGSPAGCPVFMSTRCPAFTPSACPAFVAGRSSEWRVPEGRRVDLTETCPGISFRASSRPAQQQHILASVPSLARRRNLGWVQETPRHPSAYRPCADARQRCCLSQSQGALHSHPPSCRRIDLHRVEQPAPAETNGILAVPVKLRDALVGRESLRSEHQERERGCRSVQVSVERCNAVQFERDGLDRGLRPVSVMAS